MERMPENVNHGELTKGVLKTVTRCLVHEETQRLAELLLTKLESVDSANGAANKAKNRTIIATYKVEFGQEQIGDQVSMLELDTQRVVARDRKKSPYPEFFGEFNVAAHREMEPPELVDELGRKITVIKSLPRDSILKPYVATFETLIEKWKKPLAELKAALAAQSEAFKHLSKERTELADLLVSTHGDLEKIRPNDKKWVESFFYRWSTNDQPRKAKKKEEPQPTK